jgi:hypothetical protein
MILTDAHGRPLAEPEPLPPNATIDEKIAWIRARARWHDQIAATANEAFSKAFRKAIRRIP